LLGLLRIVAALLSIEHGLQKYIGFPSAGPSMSRVFWVQGAIDIVGGALLLVGAWTRPVAFIVSGDIAAAFSSSMFPTRFIPQSMADMLFCFVFHCIGCAGAGPGAWTRQYSRPPEGFFGQSKRAPAAVDSAPLQHGPIERAAAAAPA
jgi:putative oxidoreductase